MRNQVAVVLLAAVWAAGAGAAAEAASGMPLAVTLDDLPFVGPAAPGESRGEAVARMLAAAEARRAPLAGFVTCRNEEAEPGVLARWIEAGVTPGNHSWSHRSLDDLGLAAWRADVARCQEMLEAAADGEVRYFRYPFLHTGRERELRDAGFAVLEELGLVRAPVTVDTSEWVLVRPYAAALEAGDAALAGEIGDAYVAHVRTAARRAVRVTAELGWPDAPQVLLLHANLLAADRLGELLDGLAADGFRFVPLADALDDPLYAREDHWAGGIGLSWLYRVDPAVDADRRWTWDAAQEHGLAVRFGGEKVRPAFDLDRDLAIRRVAEGTWVVTSTVPWPANSLLAEMPDGTLLLADTPATGAATRALLEWAEARFGERPLAVVNTHAHPDAVGGNRVAAEGGATVYGSLETARLVAATRGTVGQAMAAELAGRPELAAEFAPYRPLAPQRTFAAADGLRLELGGERVEVVFPGAAHTPDNLVVWLPRRRVLFGGCIVRAGGGLGNVAEADLESWPDAIRSLRAYGAEIVIPGHGDRSDPGLLEHTLELLRTATPGS